MNKWLSTDDATKRRAYSLIAESKGISSFAAEKDWWVVQVLRVIFEMKHAKHFVFKGGTSLSKAWKLIERFSEDIDLAMDMDFFGIAGNTGKNQRDKLRKSAGSYVDQVFFPALRAAFETYGFSAEKLILEEGIGSDRDRKINFYYPNVIPSPGYMEPRVQIEIGCRSLREPLTLSTFSSFLEEIFPEMEFAQAAITVPAVNPERTFLEKIFLLHEEFQRPAERIRVNRMSRHLYDVGKLSDTPFADKALDNPVLYETIVQHRYTFTRVGGVDYNLHEPRYIDPLPPYAFRDAWSADYHTMLEHMIFEKTPPSFEQLLDKISAVKLRINRLPWQFKTRFPTIR